VALTITPPTTHPNTTHPRLSLARIPVSATLAANEAEYRSVLAEDSWLESKVSEGGTSITRVREQIDERSTRAGQQVSTHAQDLRSVGDQLRLQGKEQPAKIADQAADRLERAGRWLSESDADRIISDVEDFARRNPWAVMAGGLALGVAASRMLKASSADRYRAGRPVAPPATPVLPPAGQGGA